MAGLVLFISLMGSEYGKLAAQTRAQRSVPRPRSRVNYTANTNPAYKKNIPGSTKLKKASYEQHRMQTLGGQPSNNRPAPQRYPAGGQPVSASRVLTSAPRSSPVNIGKRIDRPVASFSNTQPMSQADFQFMGKLAEDMKLNNPELSLRFGEIIEGQKQNRLLTKSEYDLMLSTSRKIDNAGVSYQLLSIAEKRRQQMYAADR